MSRTFPSVYTFLLALPLAAQAGEPAAKLTLDVRWGLVDKVRSLRNP